MALYRCVGSNGGGSSSSDLMIAIQIPVGLVGAEFTFTDGTTTFKKVLTSTMQSVAVPNIGTWTISHNEFGIYSGESESVDIPVAFTGTEMAKIAISTDEAAYMSAIVTATNGTVTKTATLTSGAANIYVSNGTWSLTNSVDGRTKVIEVTEVKTYNYVLKSVSIYGATWDGTATTKWVRTDDAVSFVDPVAAVSNGNGSSPFDDLYPWSDMTLSTDSVAGSVVKIPKFWYKWERNGAAMTLKIADAEEDGFKVCPACMDRGDGKGERDFAYVGRYHCDSSYKSTTGVNPLANQTRATFRSGISNLRSDIWQNDFAMRWTISMLYLVEYADWNTQNTIGYGCSDAGAVQNSGLTDTMVYHTGTNAASKTTWGHTQYRHIEDLWGNVLDWVDGVYFSGTTVYGILNPANFSDTTGGTNIGTRASSTGYISGYTNPSVSGYEWALYPNTVNGTDTTYVCDRCYYNASGVVLYAGGYYVQSAHYGLFYLYGYNAATDAGAYFGSRLMILP